MPFQKLIISLFLIFSFSVHGAEKKKAVIICYPADETIKKACERVASYLKDFKDCKGKFDVETLNNYRPAQLEEHFKSGKYPNHVPVFILGHGTEYIKSQKHVISMSEMAQKDKKEKKEEEIETQKILNAIDGNLKNSSKWIFSCFSGGVCLKNKGMCVGTTCLNTEPTYVEWGKDLDPATRALLEIYCDNERFKKADVLPRRMDGKAGGDGKLSHKELEEAVCAPDVYDIVAQSYFPKELEKWQKQHYGTWSFAPNNYVIQKVLKDGKLVTDKDEKGKVVTLHELRIHRRCVKIPHGESTYFNTPQTWNFTLFSPKQQRYDGDARRTVPRTPSKAHRPQTVGPSGKTKRRKAQ